MPAGYLAADHMTVSLYRLGKLTLKAASKLLSGQSHRTASCFDAHAEKGSIRVIVADALRRSMAGLAVVGQAVRAALSGYWPALTLLREGAKFME